MIKRITLLKRRPDLTVEQFVDHWQNVHAPLALKFPGLRRYVQNVIVGGEAIGVDGVAETWWDDEASMEAAFVAPESAVVQADVATFLSEVIPLVVKERVVRDTTPAG